MNKVITTTTIYPMGEVLEKYDYIAGRDGWTLVVAGDLKTPNNIKLKNGVYLSPRDQEKIDKKLSDLTSWNSIQRRNFALLYAHKELKADLVSLQDDDNDPLDNWGKDYSVGQKIQVRQYSNPALEVFDPIGATNHKELWHRGFPLQLVSQRHNHYHNYSDVEVKIDIRASFWQGDPDIPQDCRYIYRPECNFDSTLFPFTSTEWSPFNSQNTIISKEVLPHYAVLPHIQRQDDLWISYYVQALGFKVGYFAPTVYQKRNPQNEDKNMEGEYLGHSQTLKLIRALKQSPYNLFNFLPERTAEAFKQYQTHFE